MPTKTTTQPSKPSYTARLKDAYVQQFSGQLQKDLSLKNIHQVPRLERIVVSVGIGKQKDDKQHHERVVNTLRKITGQQPIDRMAKKSIATFKIRAGMNRVGVSVTLRGNTMYEFLDRLINVSLPRVRDFHGVPTGAFDHAGNYNLGIVEQSIFSELSFEDTAVLHGMQVTMVIKSQEPAHSRALLEMFGMPFEKEGKR